MTKNRKALYIAASAALVLAILLSVYALYRVKRMYRTLLERIDLVGEQVVDYLENQPASIDMDRPVYEFDYSWMKEGNYVAHAFGGIEEHAYTNSLEAFEENYARGHRIFEVDMVYFPGEYKLVLCHDDSSWRGTSAEEELPYTREAFMSSKIDGKYTPMDLEALIKLMAEYPDIYIVTDTKFRSRPSVILEFFQIVSEAKKIDPSVLDRIIPQIYEEDMLWLVMEVYPFRSVIYTLYLTEWTPVSVYDFCFRSGCRYVTMGASLADPETLAFWDTLGIRTAVHTVNDPDEAKAFFDMGVDMIYTDFLSPQDAA